MFPGSINYLLAQINQLFGPVEFGSAGNVHTSLHRDTSYLGNTQIMMP